MTINLLSRFPEVYTDAVASLEHAADEPDPTPAPDPTTGPDPTPAPDPTTGPDPTPPDPTTGPDPTPAPDPTTGPDPIPPPDPTTGPDPTNASDPTASHHPAPGPNPTPTPIAVPWCRCDNCRPMARDIENKCCRLRPCMTTEQHFHDVVLNGNVLAFKNQ